MSEEDEFDGRSYFVRLVTNANIQNLELGLFSDGTTFLYLDGVRIFYQLEVNEYDTLFVCFEVEFQISTGKDLDLKTLNFAATRRPNFGGISLSSGAEGPVVILYSDLILSGEEKYDLDNLKWVIDNMIAWNNKVSAELFS